MILAPGVFIAGVVIFLIVSWDAFEAIILPRRVTRKFRFARLFYKSTWRVWKFATGLLSSRKSREALLGFYGPLSLLVLVGVWAVGLVVGFGLMQYGAGSAIVVTGGQPIHDHFVFAHGCDPKRSLVIVFFGRNVCKDGPRGSAACPRVGASHLTRAVGS